MCKSCATKSTRIAPSLLPAADLSRLADEVARLSHVDMLHIDVMDGHFVPNFTFGPPVIRCLRPKTSLFFDCHLMMDNPGDYLDAFADAGANSCTVHVEVGNTRAYIAQMRERDMLCGVAINPATHLEEVLEFLPHVDMITVMTVVPGFGGQAFMHEVLPKMQALHDEIVRRGVPVSIEVDGGVNKETATFAAAHGADTFVGGNAIFGAPDPGEAALELRDIIQRARQQARQQ